MKTERLKRNKIDILFIDAKVEFVELFILKKGFHLKRD